MVEKRRLIDGAGVVVQPAGDREIDGEVLLRHAERAEVFYDRRQLVKAGVEGLVAAAVALERGEDLGIRAADGDELQDLVGLFLRRAALLDQNEVYLVRADLVELVHGAHDVARTRGKAEHGVEAVEDLAVVDADLEPVQTHLREGLVDDRRDLGLVCDVEPAVADDVDVRLIELTEAAALGALAAVDLADLIAAEREGQLAVVQRDVFCQRHSQVKAKGQVAVALLEAVDLLFRLAAALGEQHVGRLDRGRVERRKAVEAVRPAQNLHHGLHLCLRRRQQLHEAG